MPAPDLKATGSYPGVSASGSGIRGRCPRCGKGKLFKGFLGLQPACSECGLDFAFADSGDGPAVFITFIAGFIVVGLALAVESIWGWPYWLHMVVWIPTIIALCVGLMRPFKGWFVGVQFRHKAAEGRLDTE